MTIINPIGTVVQYSNTRYLVCDDTGCRCAGCAFLKIRAREGKTVRFCDMSYALHQVLGECGIVTRGGSDSVIFVEQKAQHINFMEE
jgi:hypothetical protein